MPGWSGTAHAGLGRRRRVRNRGEVRLDLRFDRGLVEIADRDDRHQIGPVPIGVELLQPFGVGVPDDVRLADREPLGVPRAVEQDGKLRVLDPLVGAESEPPFFQDDAPLAVDLLRIERDVLRPVFEDEQRPVHHHGLSAGTCSSYTVSSKLVCAFTCAPNRMPSDCMKPATACRGKCRVPLKLICSTKWASPR